MLPVTAKLNSNVFNFCIPALILVRRYVRFREKKTFPD